MTDRLHARQLQGIEDTRALIDKHGWALIGVFPAQGDTGAPFTYTVGLTAQFLPELVVYGLDHRSAGAHCQQQQHDQHHQQPSPAAPGGGGRGRIPRSFRRSFRHVA